MPRAEGEGRRVVLLGGEPGSGKSRLVREFAARGGRATARSSSTAPATRWCARPTGRSSRRSISWRAATEPAELRAALGTARRRADPAAARPGRAGRRAAARRSRPIPTPSATACTRRSPTCSPASAAAGRCCSCSRTATGPTRRRSCCCATWRGRPAARALLLLATFRDTEADVPDALSETLADLRRSDDVVRLRLDGPLRRRGGRVRPPRRRDGDVDPGRPSSPGAIRDLTDGNAFLVCELWRALRRDRARRGRRRRDPPHPAAAELGTPRERARGRQPAALAPGAGHHRPARARGHGRRRVRARRRPPRRRARRARSCSPRSTRPSAAG